MQVASDSGSDSDRLLIDCDTGSSSENENLILASDDSRDSSSDDGIAMGSDDSASLQGSDDSVSLQGSSSDGGIVEEAGGGGSEEEGGEPRGHKRPRAKAPDTPQRDKRPRAGLPQCQSLYECFEWPTQALRIALDSGIDIYGRLGRFQWKFSSHFSGLGSVELALQMLRVAFSAPARGELQVEVVSACENSPLLRRRILSQRFSGCIFKTIEGHLTSIDLSGLGPNADGLGPNAGTCAEAIGKAKLAPTCACSRHGECKPQAVHIDVSGSPCRPWSVQTRGPKGFAHKDGRLLIAWCAVVRASHIPIAIHENVKGFEESTLRELLGDRYDITALHAEPSQVGFSFLRRPRWYHVVCLRDCVATPSLAETYARLTAGLQRSYSPSWHSLVFQASDEELLEEENRTRKQRRMERVAVASTDWRYLLTPDQRGYVDSYIKMVSDRGGDPAESDPNLVFDLSVAPSYRGPLSFGGLPTLRCNSTRMWSPSRRRWLLPAELAAAMGFPVRADLATAARVPVDVLTPTCPRNLGNAMHVGNVGLVLLAVMLSVEWATTTS